MGFFSELFSELFTIKNIEGLTEKLKKIEKEIQNIEDEEKRKKLFLKKLQEYDNTLPVNSGLKAKKSTTTVLILAIKSNCPNVAKTILGMTNSNLNVKDNEGKTALHHAIQQEVTEIVERSKQITRIDIVGRKPSDKTISLQRKAIIARNINITQLLIEEISETRQTDIFYLKDNEGNTPLDYATADQSAKIEIEKLLSDATEQSNRHINAIGRFSDVTDTPPSRSYNMDDIDRLKKKFIELEETIKQFLEKSPGNIKSGNNPMLLVQKSYNTTPLTLAIKSDCLHVAEIILESTNNNLYVQDNKRKTALHHAIEKKATDIAKLLIEKILETGRTSIFRMPDNEGKTVLDYATAKDTEIEKLLSDAMEQSNSGCFSDVKNTSSSRFYGTDKINYFKEQLRELEETIKQFLEEVPGGIQLGTNPILVIKDYKTTPLILAIKSGYPRVAKTILRATNNNLDVQDDKGKTALHYAALNKDKDTETIKLLIKKILETDRTDIFYIKDKKDKTALGYAIANQDTEIGRLLSDAMGQSSRRRNDSGCFSDGDVTDTSITYSDDIIIDDEQGNNETNITEGIIPTEEVSDSATKNEAKEIPLNHSIEEKDANNQQTDSTLENTPPKEEVSGEDKSNVRKIHQMKNKTDSESESKGRCKTVMLAALITAVITASLLIYFTSLSALAITAVTCTSSLASGGISAILPTSKLNETKCSNILDGKNPFITQ